jgi:hypothetical protein
LKVEEDATWYDKPFNVQKAEVYALAAEKQAEIRAGVVPIMPEGL